MSAVQHIIDEARLNAAEKKTLQGADTLRSAIAKLTAVENKTEKQTALLQALSARQKAGIFAKAAEILNSHLPKFFYVSHYDRMSGEISANKLAQDRQQGTVNIGDQIFLDFLELERFRFGLSRDGGVHGGAAV